MPAARRPSGPPPPLRPPQFDRVVAAIRERYDPERIILFGSYAWGTPREDSDVDLLIVKETKRGFFERCAEVRRLVRTEKRGMPLDVIVYTPDEFERCVAEGNPIIADILRRGIVLHAA